MFKQSSSLISELEIDVGDERYPQGFYLYNTEDSSSVVISATGGNYWWDTTKSFAGVDSLITKVDVSNPSIPSVTASFQFDGQILSSRRIGKHLFFASRYYPTLPGEQPWTQSPEVWAEQVDSTELSAVLPQYVTEDESVRQAGQLLYSALN